MRQKHSQAEFGRVGVLPVTCRLIRRWNGVWGMAHNAAHNAFLTLPAYASSRELEAPQPGR